MVHTALITFALVLLMLLLSTQNKMYASQVKMKAEQTVSTEEMVDKQPMLVTTKKIETKIVSEV